MKPNIRYYVVFLF